MAPLAKIVFGVAGAIFITSTLAAPVKMIDSRQLAGEGNLFDSLFTDTDSGVGYGVENAENNLAQMLGGTPAPGPGTRKRQADKIANGASNLLNALHLTSEADLVKTDGDSVDGQLTDDATNIGAQFGGDEEDVLERVGNLVPNKMPTAPAAV